MTYQNEGNFTLILKILFKTQYRMMLRLKMDENKDSVVKKYETPK